MTNQNYTEQCIDYNQLDDAVLEQLAERQSYLDVIDADMEAFYAVKTEAISYEI